MKSKFKDFRFDLFGSTWNVTFVGESPLNKNKEEGTCNLGWADDTHNTILIATLDNEGKPLSEEQIKITMWHELFHAILGTGQYLQTNQDEPLVEWMGRCMRSLTKQKVFENEVFKK